MKDDIHVSNMDCISAGVTNLFQSWVPFGISFKICSAVIMPPSHEDNVLLKVVRNIDPPDFKVLTQHCEKHKSIITYT